MGSKGRRRTDLGKGWLLSCGLRGVLGGLAVLCSFAGAPGEGQTVESPGADGPAASVSRGASLEVFGVEPMMTGWHELWARSSLPELHYVRFRVNGRDVSSRQAFSAELYFGQTPQPRTVRVVGYDAADRPLLSRRLTVNPGGLATTVEFLEPSSGAKVLGPTSVLLCVRSPASTLPMQPLLSYQPHGASPRHLVPKMSDGSCGGGGRVHRAVVPFEAGPATLSARLVVGGNGQHRPLEQRSTLKEEIIVLNGRPDFDDRVDVRLLEWPVQVSQRRRPVQDLDLQNFELLADGHSRPVQLVVPLEEVPLRIGLVFDWSSSTETDLAAESRAASEFIEQTLVGGRDAVFISGISRRPVPLLGWTRDPEAIAASLDRVRRGLNFGGGSAFHDTLMEALYEFQSTDTKGLPALVVLTDGHDTTSESFGRGDLLAYAREAGVRIYVIAVHARVGSDTRTASNVEVLSRLAEETGGSMVVVELDGRSLQLTKRARELRRHAEDLRRRPGELAEDPRFLAYLIEREEREAKALENKAAALRGRESENLERIREAFRKIRQDLEGSYLVVSRGLADRADRFHRVEVRLRGLDDIGRYEVRSPAGLFW